MSQSFIISSIAIILVVAGYLPYIRDTLAGTTRPHIFSYLLFTLTSGSIFFLQLDAGGGAGSYVTGVVFLFMLTIFLLSFRNGKRDIALIDIVLLVCAIIGLIFWLLVDQPIISNIILVGVNVSGFLPTIRKSWSDPFSETSITYSITCIRHIFDFFGLAQINIVTALFPLAWICMNALLVVILYIRRKNIHLQ